MIAVAAAAAVAGLLMPSIERETSHLGRLLLAVLALGLLAWHVRVLGSEVGRRAWRAVLVAALVLGVGNYVQFDRKVATNITDYTDVTYYYLNSKYFDELSYFGLYAAMLQSDRERGDGFTDHVEAVRDQRDHEVRSDEFALLDGRRIRDDRFSEARWKAFGDDSATLLAQFSKAALADNFFVDHGYNPPPPWTLFGALVSENTPVAYVPTITRIDLLLVGAMLAAMVWAFGVDAAGIGFLWLLVTFSGRWPILGQSLLRFDWLAALVIAVALLRRGWFATAGAALAFAALNRVFPVIFLAPAVLVSGWTWWTEGRLRDAQRRFGWGAGMLAAVLIAATLARHGAGSFRDSAENLWLHNQSYSSHRLGLGAVLVYQGERSREDVVLNGGIAAKERRIVELQRTLQAAGLGTLVLVAAAAVRARRADWELPALATLPLFCATNAQIGYWNLRLVPVLWHAACLADGRDRSFHLAGLALLFVVEVATQGAMVAGLDRYLVTTTASFAMAAYFLVLVVGLIATARSR